MAITKEQIKQLKAEAEERAAGTGDIAEVDICELALEGDPRALLDCERVLARREVMAAIESSLATEDTVRLDWSNARAEVLLGVCGGDLNALDDTREHEFWGTNPIGAHWRVHLVAVD